MKLSRSRFYQAETRDRARALRHQGYRRESLYREKYIVQDFVSGLSNDWKVLVFHDKFYVLRRENRPGDFRASGSGLFSFDDVVDERILDAASEIIKVYDVPVISLDLALQEDKVVLIEMQFVYFGTSTLEKSPYYYQKSNQGWEQIYAKSLLEVEYARSISLYLEGKKT